ncbi:MAG TPA: LacI family DNA-binding transcriptional regulator [Steroidobacteraceae bacterium]|nr:LacI family DNA-binding transcriptional regulator [Steroidobacteraceae bacterium]
MKRSPRRRRDAVTMHEVAKHAGVSPMTVSRALSGDAHVEESTRRRVEAAVKELGYFPNVAARNLARASALHLGLLYNNPSAAYLNELLVGVLEQSSRAGCQIVLEKCGLRNERAAIDRLVRDGVGGIILPPPLSDSNAALEAVRAAKVPFIAVATGRPEEVGITVRIDDLEAAMAMTRYLLGLGHRDIGFIVGAPNQTVSAQRQSGFERALHDAGLAPHAEWVKPGSFSYRSGLAAAEQILSQAHRPTAIFASNDDMAAAAIAVAHRMRLDVPRDLTIVGFDDTTLAATIWPALTTVRQPIAAMARKAVELLLEEIRLRRQGRTLAPLQHFMKFTLVKRESSAAIA